MFLAGERRKVIPSFVFAFSYSFLPRFLLSLSRSLSPFFSSSEFINECPGFQVVSSRARNLDFTFLHRTRTPPGLLSYRYSKSQWIDRLKKLTEDLVNEIYTSGAEIEEASLNIWSARLTTRIIMASRGSLSVRKTSAKHRSLFLYGGL